MPTPTYDLLAVRILIIIISHVSWTPVGRGRIKLAVVRELNMRWRGLDIIAL